MFKAHTYEEIATDWNLWAEFVDPSGESTEEQFNAWTVEEKIAIQVDIFGAEEEEGGAGCIGPFQ